MPGTSVDIIDQSIKIPLSVPLLAVHLRNGRTQAEIGRICGVSRQAVHEYISRNNEVLAPLLPKDDDIMALTARQIANKAMSKLNEVLDEATKKDLIALNAISGTHIEKYRLLSDQSTENIAQALKISVTGEGGEVIEDLGLTVSKPDKQPDKCKAQPCDSVPIDDNSTVNVSQVPD